MVASNGLLSFGLAIDTTYMLILDFDNSRKSDTIAESCSVHVKIGIPEMYLQQHVSETQMSLSHTICYY
jgi:hypothetical protein